MNYNILFSCNYITFNCYLFGDLFFDILKKICWYKKISFEKQMFGKERPIAPVKKEKKDMSVRISD